MIVASSAAALGCHHARLGLNLNLAVDLEGAGRNDQLAFLQPVLDEVVIFRAWTEHDFSALEGWLVVGGE